MGNTARDERSEDRGNQPGVREGGRSPTGVAPGGAAAANGAGGPLKPGERWTTTRKREVVIRLLRGESIESLSRELSVESYRLQEWYDRAMASMEVGLKERGGGDPVELQLKRAQAMVGELTMMNELYQERLRRVEHRPFDPKRSRR